MTSRTRCAMTLTLGVVAVSTLSAEPRTPRNASPPVWGRCPADPVTINGTRYTSWASGGGECATRAVPMHWAAPDGDLIEVFTARYRAPSSRPRRGQLILLDGGPGGTGAAFTPGLEGESLANLRADGWDLVVPTHRGTGRSTPLPCGTLTDAGDVRRCGTKLQRKLPEALRAFGPVDAALDVCDLARHLRREEGGRVALYGISYGTFLAQATIASCEAEIDALILDGVMPADVSFDDLPAADDDFARRLLGACADNATCRAALDGNPVAALEDVLSRAQTGTLCPPLDISAAGLKGAMMGLAAIGDQAPVLVPALIHRLRRCGAQDVAAVSALVARLDQVERVQVKPHRVVAGDALGMNASCLIYRAHTTLGLDALAAREAQALLTSGDATTQGQRCLAWPSVTGPAFPRLRAPVVPTLMLQGEFDPRTTLAWARQAARTFDGPFQTLVVVPTGRHGTMSPTGITPNTTCPVRIAAAFLAGPSAPVETGCLASNPIDWSGHGAAVRALALATFGVPDLWGDEGGR